MQYTKSLFVQKNKPPCGFVAICGVKRPGYDDLVAAGSVAAAREKGQVRTEGKEYVMQDGDVTNFLFNG
jgi:ribosome-binding ATPase YchF (GTP1/OBG family)